MPVAVKSQPELPADGWIGLKATANYLHKNEKLLRAKTVNGQWKFYPQLTRIQEGKRCNIYFLRAEVESLKAEIERAAKEQRPLEAQQEENPYHGLRQQFARYPGLLRQLGVTA
jgi:hypothetical protein